MGMAATQQTGGLERERERGPAKQFLLRVPLTWSWHLSAGYCEGGGSEGRGGFKLHQGVIIQPLRWEHGWLRTQPSGFTEPNKRFKSSILGFCNLDWVILMCLLLPNESTQSYYINLNQFTFLANRVKKLLIQGRKSQSQAAVGISCCVMCMLLHRGKCQPSVIWYMSTVSRSIIWSLYKLKYDYTMAWTGQSWERQMWKFVTNLLSVNIGRTSARIGPGW